MIYPAFYFDANRSVDLICMGRVAVDLYAEQIGVSLSDAQSFKKYLGVCREHCGGRCPPWTGVHDVFLCGPR